MGAFSPPPPSTQSSCSFSNKTAESLSHDPSPLLKELFLFPRSLGIGPFLPLQIDLRRLRAGFGQKAITCLESCYLQLRQHAGRSHWGPCKLEKGCKHNRLGAQLDRQGALTLRRPWCTDPAGVLFLHRAPVFFVLRELCRGSAP